ncbi:MAG: G5 domain-containing protein [Candidatus Berkelbacteria bacterium]|nr:G5 domain-containing protein [Candidatus Berkelbacteria bacterium]
MSKLGGNILRLWQVSVITILLLAVFLDSCNYGLFSGKLSNTQSSIADHVPQDNRLGREVISRDFREFSNSEVYYGKPGVFYLNEMLIDNNVVVYPEDIIKVFPDPSYGVGSKIIIYRAPQISLWDGNDKKIYRTWVRTVEEVLQEKQITLGDKDVINPSIDTLLTNDLEIKITRVAETNLIEKDDINFKVIKKEDPNLEKGKSKIIQSGKKGIKERIFKIRRENGKEVSRQLIEEKVTTNARDQIEVYGTKQIITVRCLYNDIVSQAAAKYNIDPNEICNLMMKESNGHYKSVNPAGPYYGLFQYSQGFWDIVSSKAGNGNNIFAPSAQILNTAWALSNGYRGRWP